MKWVIQLLYLCSLFPVLITIRESTAFSITSSTSSPLVDWDLPSLESGTQLNMNPPTNSLSERYESIIQQTASMTKPWPDSDGFANCCLDSNSDDSFSIPRFPKGTGPLGVFAMTRDNTHTGNQKLVETCLQAFDAFCRELNERILYGSLDDHFVLVKSLVPHITVAIFQEHPQLLSKKNHELGDAGEAENQDEFHFFSDQDGTILAQNLANQTSHFPPIQLSLHSLMLTPDGAMIAGFVDESDDDLYAKLKTDILEGAKDVMGAHRLTSRPKNLIHITCGRVVRKPGSSALEESTQHGIQDLVNLYNQQVFPELISTLKSIPAPSNRDKVEGPPPIDGTFVLKQMTLLRNDVWLCEENTVYGIGKLQGRGSAPL